VQGLSAGFTGSQNGDFANDVQGNVGAYVYSIQGNILTSSAVLAQAETAFRDGGGCDLADRLMLALEAGADNGEGDSRCTPGGIPSDSAFIHVDLPDGTVHLHLQAVNLTTSPVADLRVLYDAWRLDNACPLPQRPDAGPAAVDAALGAVDGGDDVGGDDGCGCSTARDHAGGAVLLVLVMLGLRRRA